MKELRELQQQYPGLVQLLTRKDVARLAGVSTATIKRDVKRGLLKEIAPNARRRRYHPKDVEAYLAAKFPALAYTKRRLSTIQTAGNPSGGDVETPDGNDSPARPDAKMAGSGAKGADCPENPPKAQQREVSRPIINEGPSTHTPDSLATKPTKMTKLAGTPKRPPVEPAKRDNLSAEAVKTPEISLDPKGDENKARVLVLFLNPKTLLHSKTRGSSRLSDLIRFRTQFWSRN